MHRTIESFVQDDTGEWVAVLECGHRQHVRHRPPWQERPWVLSAEGRVARIGSPLVCRICDEGGDSACWVPEVCPECGGLDAHRPECTGGMTPAGA